jgi:hypothetical protein
MYQLSLATDPVASPHAKFVSREGTPQPQEETHKSRAAPVLAVFGHLWRAFWVSARFLMNMTPPKDKQIPRVGSTDRVQQLQVWIPGELEMSLFSIYSPVHCLLWMALTSTNWIIMAVIMAVVSMQVSYIFLIILEGCLSNILADSCFDQVVPGTPERPCYYICRSHA